MKIVGGLIAADSGEIELLGRRLGAGPLAAGGDAARAALRPSGALALPQSARVREFCDRAAGRHSRACAGRRAAARSPGPRSTRCSRATRSIRAPRSRALSLSQQQMVEIARATSHPATRLLIFDEPTSSLGAREAEQLRAYMRQRRGEGISFIFISHRLRETLDMADRIMVMRNGRSPGRAAPADRRSRTDRAAGRQARGRRRCTRGADTAARREALVRVRDLRGGSLRGVSLEVGRRRDRRARRARRQRPAAGPARGFRRRPSRGRRCDRRRARSLSSPATARSKAFFRSGRSTTTSRFRAWGG